VNRDLSDMLMNPHLLHFESLANSFGGESDVVAHVRGTSSIVSIYRLGTHVGYSHPVYALIWITSTHFTNGF